MEAPIPSWPSRTKAIYLLPSGFTWEAAESLITQARAQGARIVTLLNWPSADDKADFNLDSEACRRQLAERARVRPTARLR